MLFLAHTLLLLFFCVFFQSRLIGKSERKNLQSVKNLLNCARFTPSIWTKLFCSVFFSISIAELCIVMDPHVTDWEKITECPCWCGPARESQYRRKCVWHVKNDITGEYTEYTEDTSGKSRCENSTLAKTEPCMNAPCGKHLYFSNKHRILSPYVLIVLLKLWRRSSPEQDMTLPTMLSPSSCLQVEGSRSSCGVQLRESFYSRIRKCSSLINVRPCFNESGRKILLSAAKPLNYIMI